MNSEEIEGLRCGLNGVHISSKSHQQIQNEIVPNAEKKLLQVMVCADNKRHVYVIENQTAEHIRCLPRQESKRILNAQNKYRNIPKNENLDQNLKHITHIHQDLPKNINTQVTERKNTENKQQQMPNKIPILNENVSPEVPVRKCRNALINALIKKEQDKNQTCSLQPGSTNLEESNNKTVCDDNKCTYTILKHNVIENLLLPAEACTKTGPIFNKPRIMNPDSYFVYAQSSRKDLLKNLYHNAKPIYHNQLKSEFIFKGNNCTKTKKAHYMIMDSTINNGSEQEEKFQGSFKQQLPYKKSRNALINGLIKNNRMINRMQEI